MRDTYSGSYPYTFGPLIKNSPKPVVNQSHADNNSRPLSSPLHVVRQATIGCRSRTYHCTVSCGLVTKTV